MGVFHVFELYKWHQIAQRTTHSLPLAEGSLPNFTSNTKRSKRVEAN